MDEEVRLREPNRKQLLLQQVDYEALLDAEHPARAIWRVLEGLDLSRFCAPIRARENRPGRDATSPRMLLGLWLYGLSQGVNSAREIARLSTAHAAYRWLCGGVSVNHHLLSDFRSGHRAALDELFGQLLGLLMDRHLITLYRVAQDGTRVRASAGAASFRRKARLKACMRAARHHLELLNAEAEQDPTQCSARQRAAELRAARDYEQRVTQAVWRNSPRSARTRRRPGTIRSAKPKLASRPPTPRRG
jgi:transposase